MTKPMPNDPKGIFLQNAKNRFYLGLNYVTLFMYVVIVSTSALVADYIIVFAIKKTVASAVSQFPIVEQAFSWFQIGSAFMVLIGAATHACFSAYSQIKFEVEVAKAPPQGGSVL